MFNDVKIPNRIDSPVNEAVFEIRYNGNYPGEALYGILYKVFERFPGKKAEDLPIMQIPQQFRESDPVLRYQSFYRAVDGQFAFSIGPHSIVFSSFRPYTGWTEWERFFAPIINEIQKNEIINTIERIGLRYFDVFEENIFEHINAAFSVGGQPVRSDPSAFNTQFDMAGIQVILNIGNTAVVNGIQTKNSLIDIDCIYPFNDCIAADFFPSYKEALEKTHHVNKQVFFGLLKLDFLNKFNPEYD
jgi:uncharacterized protein (TIGR04255 family)